jgi:hypothetical protein
VLHEATDLTTGITDTAEGYVFDSQMADLPASHDYVFRILGPDGTVQKTFLFDQTKYLHFLGLRDDLTDYVHVHPNMSPDGTWTVHLPFQQRGPYHVYADFLLKDAVGGIHHMVLRRELMVPGPYKLSPVLPAPSLSGTADGYMITFDQAPKPWTVSYWAAYVTRNGQPVKDLQPYLAAFAHFTAFKLSNDLYGHAHPLEYAGGGREGWPDMPFSGGPKLTFHAEFPGAGDYRAFVQFQTNGVLHTVPFTLHIA